MAALNQTEKIKVEGLYKAYGKKTILDHIGFSVYEGEFLSVLGSSGCGKTTLLRILIGITEQNGGRILKDGVDISAFEPAKRGMGIVFQNYALFPNMTALQNVEYALKLHPDFKASSRQRALEVLSQVGMEEHSGKNRISCLAASSSAWPLRARWRCSPMCCCLMSRCPPWMPATGWRCAGS